VPFITAFVAEASAVEFCVVLAKPVAAADTDERVELTPASVTLPVEAESPVAKDEPIDFVALAGDAVMLLEEVALAFQVSGDCDVGALRAEVYGVLNAEVWAGAGISTEVVLGGYAVLPSTLVGIGRVVILVRYAFDVADVFGSEARGEDASCLGSTAACVKTTAKASELRQRSCMLRWAAWLYQM
jgi:hypothetical protein